MTGGPPSTGLTAEQAVEDVLGRWMFARHGRVSSHVGADSFLHMLAESGYVIAKVPDGDEVEAEVEVVAKAIASGAWGCTGTCSNRPCEVDYRDARKIVAALSRPADGEHYCRTCGWHIMPSSPGHAPDCPEPSRPDPASLTLNRDGVDQAILREALGYYIEHHGDEDHPDHVERLLRALSSPTAGTEDEDG